MRVRGIRRCTDESPVLERDSVVNLDSLDLQCYRGGTRLVELLARGHGGDVILEKSDDDGTVFKVTLKFGELKMPAIQNVVAK